MAPQNQINKNRQKSWNKIQSWLQEIQFTENTQRMLLNKGNYQKELSQKTSIAINNQFLVNKLSINPSKNNPHKNKSNYIDNKGLIINNLSQVMKISNNDQKIFPVTLKDDKNCQFIKGHRRERSKTLRILPTKWLHKENKSQKKSQKNNKQKKIVNPLNKYVAKDSQLKFKKYNSRKQLKFANKQLNFQRKKIIRVKSSSMSINNNKNYKFQNFMQSTAYSSFYNQYKNNNNSKIPISNLIRQNIFDQNFDQMSNSQINITNPQKKQKQKQIQKFNFNLTGKQFKARKKTDKNEDKRTKIIQKQQLQDSCLFKEYPNILQANSDGIQFLSIHSSMNPSLTLTDDKLKNQNNLLKHSSQFCIDKPNAHNHNHKRINSHLKKQKKQKKLSIRNQKLEDFNLYKISNEKSNFQRQKSKTSWNKEVIKKDQIKQDKKANLIKLNLKVMSKVYQIQNKHILTLSRKNKQKI